MKFRRSPITKINFRMDSLGIIKNAMGNKPASWLAGLAEKNATSVAVVAPLILRAGDAIC